MVGLQDLPGELLELIFRSLASIDDVHSFGRTCRKSHLVIRRPTLYVSIMRSVISKATQHRYDHQLCKMLDLHREVVKRVQYGTAMLIPATRAGPQGYIFNAWENSLSFSTTPTACDEANCSTCLSDETIYEILARYQGLRVLEQLWLERQLNASDYFSVDKSPTACALDLEHAFKVIVNRNELFKDGEIPARRSTTPETQHYKALNADQRARFYAAVTHVWLLNEIRWTFTNFTYPTRFDVQIQLLENCKENIARQRLEPLLDELDQYAVFRFMYHHILPVYGACLADGNVERLPFTFSSSFNKDFGFTTRMLQLFITTGETYFQPPDLIDLIVRCKNSRRSPFPPLAIPSSTSTFQHPSTAFGFPRNLGDNIFDDRNNRFIQHLSLTHLNLIGRSSFHQTRHRISPQIIAPSGPNAPTQAFHMRDHASDYYLDRAMVAFEVDEVKDDARRHKIRKVFSKEWDDAMWCVWWWANSEDKARAKMERWREKKSASST